MSRARPKPPREVVPASELTPEYRQRVLATVDDLTRTVEVAARKLRERAEAVDRPGHVPGIDPQMAKGLLDLAKTAAALLAAYPGLLEVTDDGELGGDGAIAGPDAVERLRSALGETGPGDAG